MRQIWHSSIWKCECWRSSLFSQHSSLFSPHLTHHCFHLTSLITVFTSHSSLFSHHHSSLFSHHHLTHHSSPHSSLITHHITSHPNNHNNHNNHITTITITHHAIRNPPTRQRPIGHQHLVIRLLIFARSLLHHLLLRHSLQPKLLRRQLRLLTRTPEKLKDSVRHGRVHQCGVTRR